MTQQTGTRADIAARAFDLLQYEADIAFRRRACTVLEYIDPHPGERILDAGCGLGFYLHLLGRLSDAEVWGLEFDAVRLGPALDDPYAGRARIVLGDVTCLPIAAEGVDKLIISEVLEHVDDDRAAMAEVLRVLRPGGVCAITVPNAAYPVLWDPLNYVRERAGLGHFKEEPLSGIWTDHVRLYERDQVVSLVRDAGLDIDEVRLETRYAFPFSHQILYGLGKYLVEHNLAGGNGDEPASRFSFWSDNKQMTLTRRLTRVFTAFDRFNRASYDRGASVNICIKATKPAARPA